MGSQQIAVVPPVRMTAHRGHVIIECDLIEWTERYIPAGGTQLGCTLLNVDEALLGISTEALAELRKVTRSHDDIGDVTMWRASDGSWCVGWLRSKWQILVSGSQSDCGGLDFNIPHCHFKRVVKKAIAAIDSRVEEA